MNKEVLETIRQIDKEQEENENKCDSIAQQIFEIYQANHITLYDAEKITKRLDFLIKTQVYM